MNRFALLSLYRSLARHRLYAVLNLGGLALGIAVFLLLGLYVRFELSFERWVPNYGQVYVVETVWNLPGNPASGPYPYTMGGLLEEIREDFPGTVGARLRPGGGVTVLRGGAAVGEDAAEADASLFDVIDLPMARGDGRRALRDPTAALVSETAARKYFGTTDPVGQTLTVAFDAPVSYRVAGVFRDLPANSDLKFSVLLPLPRRAPSENWYHWGSTELQTFLRFPSTSAARAFEGRLDAFVDRRGLKDQGPRASRQQKLRLLPLADLHLAPEGSGRSGPALTVAALGAVGVLTLLIAVLNYVNLATARAGLRAREVAMRKVLGAGRGALVRQFLGEAVLLCALAALGGLVLAELGLPVVNAAGGLELAIPYALVVPALALLAVAVGGLAGFYPAVLLSRVPAAGVLQSARSPGGGRAGSRVREALVLVQFALAIAFLIGTAVLVAQASHVRNRDLGFRRDGLLVVRSTQDGTVTPGQLRGFARTVAMLPGVAGVALGNSAPGGANSDNSDNVALPGVPGEGPSLRWIVTGPDFFRVYGARVLAGRVFDARHPGDDRAGRPKGSPAAVVINRRAVCVLGFRSPADAVGHTVGGGRPLTIIGVVDDLLFFSPRQGNGPTYYLYYREPEKESSLVLAARVAGDPVALMPAVRDAWRRSAPQVPFLGDTAAARLAEYTRADDRATRLFAIGASLAVAIGCVGLWGLASFTTERRTREVGIRKVLGASASDVVRLLVGQFLRPVLLANLVAWPLAWAAMRTWLAGFDDPVPLSPLYFLGAGALAAAIAAATVVGQALRAAGAAPARALRYE